MTERLLDYLRRQANARGLVLASVVRMMAEFEISRPDLDEALRSLEAEGRIKILSPLPYAVLAITPHSWPGSSSAPREKKQQFSSSGRSLHREVPVSSRAATATQPEDGGAGEGEALLDQVLGVLGSEADRDEFRAILLGHDPVLIHRCLKRVLATRSIRVSRAALFRALLEKLSN